MTITIQQAIDTIIAAVPEARPGSSHPAPLSLSGVRLDANAQAASLAR